MNAVLQDKTMYWPGTGTIREACKQLLRVHGGAAIVSPTYVGYILMTIDGLGLEKKFYLKERPKNKPGVVLLSSLDQLVQLAKLEGNIFPLYNRCWENGTLLGCILPWKDDAAKKFIPDDGSRQLVQDDRGTSCFVIKFGTPSEEIAEHLWQEHGKLCFASSANPSGKGNRGRLEGVGQRILDGADLVINADEWVSKQQPDKTETTRYAQGVMVSMVDEKGRFAPRPEIIRKGLHLDRIMAGLSDLYDEWDFRQGHYH